MTQLLMHYVNTHRDEKKYPDPIELPMPWTTPGDNQPDVTREERAHLEAVLASKSAFAT